MSQVNVCTPHSTVPSRKSAATPETRTIEVGLIMTLRAVLEISSYLIDEVGFKYVMTARFNQNAIEQFFGIVRSFCGPDSNPTPMKFAQIHRLLSIYSLVKPPPGTNVSE
ncbi:hypothetical protein FOCC_FOCC015749, partial [Frankliniella occidentalis]